MLKIWRTAHLALAIISFLFIAMASVTGAILSFEPIKEKNLPYKVASFDTITVANSITKLKDIYPELLQISVDNHQFVTIEGFDEEGNDFKHIVDPITGKKLANPIEKSPFMQWTTNLHRSLFLHETGRYIVGIFSILLVLIAFSGTALLLKRSKGLRGFYDKISSNFWEQFYHILAGRLLLIPIIIISITGSYLFLQRFEYLPSDEISDTIDFTSENPNRLEWKKYPAFKNLYLSDIEKIELPFDESAEEVFKVKTKTSQFTVEQISGTKISEQNYSLWNILGKWSFDLHTGQINSLWSFIIGLASIQLLFFIYSGFVITYKRIKNKKKTNLFALSQADALLLVGSENGSTWQFAKNFQEQALAIGKKIFIAEANELQTLNHVKELIIFTSTYGEGIAPANANQLINNLKKINSTTEILFSVVGFGSKTYNFYCGFAKKVSAQLQYLSWAKELTPIGFVNEKNPVDFCRWIDCYNQKAKLQIATTPALYRENTNEKQSLEVVKNTKVQSEDQLFSIEFKTKAKFQSGDLLAIYPTNDYVERLYSISKIDNQLYLMIKLHEKGIGSNYLHLLEKSEKIKARIIKNTHFYFPKKQQVICIANGTGIAPFLGMIDENNKKQKIYLYAGFQKPTPFIKELETNLHNQIKKGKLTQLNIAYSRIQDKNYVMDLIIKDRDKIANLLEQGGVIMVCGSLSMWHNVSKILEEIAISNHKSLNDYITNGQIKTDCY